jgi:HPt (histidine-containing phosphotransfer) domain-containing protein
MSQPRNRDLLLPYMDPDGTLKRLGNDLELMDQIIEIFLEDAPTLVHAAREALAKGDPAELRRSAHSLKGMMAQLSATQGVNAALRVEQCAALGDLPSASPLIHECGERVADLTRVLQAYFASGEPATASSH